MIEQYIRVLKSFKKNKISGLIEQIFMKAAYFISSEYASEELGEFFDFPLSPETITKLHSIIREINTQAGLATPESLILDGPVTARIKSMIAKASAIGAPFVDFELNKTHCGYLNIQGVIQQINIKNNIQGYPDNFELAPETLDKIKQLLVQANRMRFPFTHYELDPSNVSQMKKWMNALYYIRLTFIDLENTNLDYVGTSLQSLQVLLSQTIESAYEASFLATDLDVNFKEIFAKEITQVFQQLAKLQELSGVAKDEFNPEELQPQESPLPKPAEIQPVKPLINREYVKKAGEITGTVIDQMQPISSEVDYSFLTEFSSRLPSHIDSLTQLIQNFSSAITDKPDPKLNQEKLNEIRTAALHLLSEIENVQEGGRVSQALKILNYIHIVNNIITLSMSTLEQVRELNDSSQDIIREQLAKLKYDYLPLLLSLSDKIEINAMLKPGTLSAPLMKSIIPLYNAILWLPRKLLDFTTHGEDLLIIEDSRFIELRQEETHKRINLADGELRKTRKAKEELMHFYNELEKPEYANLALHELPKAVLERLETHYKLIESYSHKLDPEFNNQIISSLKNAAPLESALMKLARRLWHGSIAPNHISLILKQKKALEHLITKDEKSHLFQIKLNRNLIKSIRANSSLTIFPHPAAQNIYAVDEGVPLEMSHEERIPFILKEEEFFQLQENLSQFNQLIKNQIPDDAERLMLHTLNDETKAELAILYKKVRPYWPYIVPTKQQQAMENLGKYFTKVFTNKIITSADVPLIKTYNELTDASSSYIATTRRSRPENVSDYFSIKARKYCSSAEAKSFVEQEEKRIRFQKEGSHMYVANQDQLNADQIYSLTQWYQKKQNQLKEAQTAYTEFCQLSNELGLTGTILKITVLNPSVRERLCSLYSQFQPWFILSAPEAQKEKAIELDRYLSGIISRKTNPTLTKKELEQVQRDMVQFATLIIRGTEPRSKMLTLQKLDEATKEELKRLYDAIHEKIPDLASIISPEHKKAFLHLDEYLFAALDNQPIDKKDRVSVEGFKVLAQKSNEFLNRTLMQWHKKSYARFDTVESNLVTTELLTISQILNFYQKHRNKRNNPKEIEAAYSQFLQLLGEQDINGSLRKLEQLDEDIKSELYRLYKIFQPHFLNTIASGLKDDAQMIGKYVAAVLSSASIKTITDLQTDVHKALGEHAHFLHMKYQHFHQLSETKFTEEQNAGVLELDPNASKVRHLLGDKKYAEQIQTYRTYLFELREKFNKAMNQQLVPKPTGVPYPEMERSFSQLAQSKQVRAIKELYNAFYHFEGIVKELEQLTDDNLRGPYTNAVAHQYRKALKAKFVYRLLKAYGHIEEMINLTQRLAKDPHFSLIAQDLMQQAQGLYAAFQKHTDAYQTSYETVPVEGTVQYSPLWYILNGFFIIPPHIRALKYMSPLSPEDLDNLHQKAKRSTLIIEGLINNSDSYWKLLLKTPEMIKLYSALSKKLDEFTTTTHDTVFENLKDTRNNVFTPMLLWADAWEQQIGLKPGIVSDPLRELINEFYKGFLSPLHLTSKEHIDLIFDQKPLEQRVEATEHVIKKASEKIQRVKNKYQSVSEFYLLLQQHKELLASYNSYIPGTNKATLKDIEASQQKIKRLYKGIIPILAKLKEKKAISVEPTTHPEDHVFDTLCNEGLKAYDLHFTEIDAWVTSAYNYQVGVIETQNMAIQTAQEKITRLTQLEETEVEERVQFIDEYTREAFQKHLKTALNHHIGFQCVNKEYLRKLNEFIANSQETIIEDAKKQEDINFYLNDQLTKQVSKFKSTHYAKHYHLDLVQASLAQFTVYFNRVQTLADNKTAVFESKATLAKKTIFINKLMKIAEDEQKAIDLRLAEISAEVNSPLFRKTILDCRSYSSNTKNTRYLDPQNGQDEALSSNAARDLWNYLKQCFFNLLEAVYLFTPTRKKLFNQLHHAVNNPPKIEEMTKHCGLFGTGSKEKKKRETPEETPDSQPGHSIS